MAAPFILGAFTAHEESLSNAVQGLQLAKKAGCDAYLSSFWSSPARMRARRHIEAPTTAHDEGSARPEWLGYLKNGCSGLDMLFACEVSLPEDVELVATHADAFVVSSYESRDRELTRAIAAARGERPFFVSTGMQDGREDMDLPKEAILLHTVVADPCPLESANLGAIEPHEGYADFTRCIYTGGLAVMAGADYLLVPFRLTHTSPTCAGYAVALSPTDLTKYVYFSHEAAAAKGAGEKVVQEIERAQLRHRVVR